MKIKDIMKTVTGWVDAGAVKGPAVRGGTPARRSAGTSSSLLNIVIIVLINLVGLTMNFRCDLTRNDTYSLSDESRDIVSNLKENLKIKVLFSKDLPAQHTAIFRYLKDLLEEYDYYANEYFSYEIIDDKDLEKAAADYGIRPVQSQEIRQRPGEGAAHLHGRWSSSSRTLSRRSRRSPSRPGLEYNITSLIEKMSGKIDGLLRLKEPIKVCSYMDGTLSSLPIDGIDTLEG